MCTYNAINLKYNKIMYVPRKHSLIFIFAQALYFSQNFMKLFVVYSEDTSEALQWLKNNSEPFTEVVEKWKATYIKRNEELPPTIVEYFGFYPGLRHPLGYLLLEEDFKVSHPDKDSNLLNKWPHVCQKILQVAKTRKDTYIKEVLQTLNDKIHDGKF